MVPDSEGFRVSNLVFLGGRVSNRFFFGVLDSGFFHGSPNRGVFNFCGVRIFGKLSLSGRSNASRKTHCPYREGRTRAEKLSKPFARGAGERRARALDERGVRVR